MGCRIVGVDSLGRPRVGAAGALIFIPSSAIPPATRASSTTWSAARPSAAIPPVTRASSTTRSAAPRPSRASPRGAALTCVCFCHLPPDDRAGFVAAGRAAGVRRSSAAPVSAGRRGPCGGSRPLVRSAVGLVPKKVDLRPFMGFERWASLDYRRFITRWRGVHGCSSGFIFKISEAPRRAVGTLGVTTGQARLLIVT